MLFSLLTDPFEWAESFKKKYILVIVIFFISVALVLGARGMIKDQYELRLTISEMLKGQSLSIEELRIDGMLPLSNKEIFQIFVANLNSPTVLSEVLSYSAMDLSSQSVPDSNDVKGLMSRLNVGDVKFDESEIGPLTVQIELVNGDSQQELRDLIKDVLSITNKMTLSKINEFIRADVSKKISDHELGIQSVENRVDISRITTSNLTQDKIARIELEIGVKKTLDEVLTKDLINIVEDEISDLILKDHQVLIDEITLLELQMDEDINTYEKIISDMLLKLDEQIRIAKAVDLSYPLEVTQLNSSDSSFVSVNADRSRFLDGYIALEEEKRIINERTDLQPFNQGLRDFQEGIEILKRQIGQEEFVSGLRDLQIEKESLQNRLGKMGYIDGLRELESNLEKEKLSQGLDIYVDNLRESQEQLFLLKNDPTYLYKKQFIDKNTYVPLNTEVVMYNPLESEVLNVRNLSMTYTLLLGLIGGFLVNFILLSGIIISNGYHKIRT